LKGNIKKMNEWTDEKIFEKLKSILAEALEVETEVINPDSLVINDLGAESIDILDISFRIEKAFKIKIPEQSLSLNPKDIPEGKTAGEIFSVQIIVDFVKEKLEEASISVSK